MLDHSVSRLPLWCCLSAEVLDGRGCLSADGNLRHGLE